MFLEEPIKITKARQRIFVKAVFGHYQRLRWLAFGTLLTIFLVTPWLRWGNRQAVWLDFPNRRFHFFGVTIWPQETYFFTLALFTAAAALFFFTALSGRLWCGYACPQTVFVNLFMKVEHWLEGDRGRQLRLDKEPWGPGKVARKVTKHLAYGLIAVVVGLTAVSYFVPHEALMAQFAGTGPAHPTMTFWLLLLTLALYLDGAFFREQVCIYPCPYGRFQGVLQDTHSLVVGYDRERGEPRRGAPRLLDLKVLERKGDCVDCNLCAQVCPQGIDIRNGTQAECISCASCVDACDQVMDKLGKPHGLIRYASMAEFAGRPRKTVRPRLVLYGSLLAASSMTLGWMAATRPEIALDVSRANALYMRMPDGRVANAYTVKVQDFGNATHRMHLAVEGLDGAEVRGQLDGTTHSGELVPLSVAVVAPAGTSAGSHRFDFVVKDGGRVLARRVAAFVAP